ncbi:MAG: ABC transporter ATP-binding protein [Candidatus Omnitrophica bacterium]|nr:ABC transporter ATP-binding protein [Candidatus Omnitrophota bacterium]MBU1923480.1 ABC transporter ATP-binding protein [Candidatus Omnitrophota bacterium]
MSIKLENISKTFEVSGKELKVLENIDLEIKDKEMLVIFGKSGVGKSTLLSIIGGMDTPTSGKVIVDGIDLSNLKADELAKFRKEKIGYIFQSFNLLGNLIAMHNIILPVILDVERMKKIATIKGLAQKIGMQGRLRHCPGELSLGEQQRVAILRAMINSPTIILADEPTAHLDIENSLKIIEIFEKLNKEQGVTIVLVTDHEAIASKFEHRFTLGV